MYFLNRIIKILFLLILLFFLGCDFRIPQAWETPEWEFDLNIPLINEEYYVDMAINDAIALNLRCVLFEIDSYICWGTPNDLRTFEYWQSCFNEWDNHPYNIELDVNIKSL